MSNSLFISASNVKTPTAHVYLAQATLSDLPETLISDVPTPDIVREAGKGDVYDSSLWLGRAPTYTPLHRDPNPNLFVQLAGKKVVRLFRPEVGHGIFARVQEQIGGTASATMRGEEMMAGPEQKVLEQEVWGTGTSAMRECWEAELDSGDGLFIPKGYWHSVKGVGEGMNGSVWVRCDRRRALTNVSLDRLTGGSGEDLRSHPVLRVTVQAMRQETSRRTRITDDVRPHLPPTACLKSSRAAHHQSSSHQLAAA
jgi:hypothetical protein